MLGGLPRYVELPKSFGARLIVLELVFVYSRQIRRQTVPRITAFGRRRRSGSGRRSKRRPLGDGRRGVRPGLRCGSVLVLVLVASEV